MGRYNQNQQEPTETPDTHGAGKRSDHAAMGFISAHRVQGTIDNLFGSEVRNFGFVEIEVHGACQTDDGYHLDQHPSGNIVASVRLTESQWVGFISRMNTSGVPCTLNMRPDGVIFPPDLPSQAIGRERIQHAADGMKGRLDKQVSDATAELAAYASKLGKRDGEAFLRALDIITSNLKSNQKYASERLQEMTEEMVNKAKTEIEGYVNGVTQRLGVQSMQQLSKMAATVELKMIGNNSDGVDTDETVS